MWIGFSLDESVRPAHTVQAVGTGLRLTLDRPRTRTHTELHVLRCSLDGAPVS